MARGRQDAGSGSAGATKKLERNGGSCHPSNAAEVARVVRAHVGDQIRAGPASGGTPRRPARPPARPPLPRAFRSAPVRATDTTSPDCPPTTSHSSCSSKCRGPAPVATSETRGRRGCRDVEGADGVRATVGHVQQTPSLVDGQVRHEIGPASTRGRPLTGDAEPPRGVLTQAQDRPRQLTCEPRRVRSPLPDQLTRACPGRQGTHRVINEAGTAETKAADLIRAQVHHAEAVELRPRDHHVRMAARLALRDRSRALEGQGLQRLADDSIRIDVQHRHPPVAIVGHHEARGRTGVHEGKVARPRTSGGGAAHFSEADLA